MSPTERGSDASIWLQQGPGPEAAELHIPVPGLDQDLDFMDNIHLGMLMEGMEGHIENCTTLRSIAQPAHILTKWQKIQK